jgi:hypothetical protein
MKSPRKPSPEFVNVFNPTSLLRNAKRIIKLNDNLPEFIIITGRRKRVFKSMQARKSLPDAHLLRLPEQDMQSGNMSLTRNSLDQSAQLVQINKLRSVTRDQAAWRRMPNRTIRETPEIL